MSPRIPTVRELRSLARAAIKDDVSCEDFAHLMHRRVYGRSANCFSGPTLRDRAIVAYAMTEDELAGREPVDYGAVL